MIKSKRTVLCIETDPISALVRRLVIESFGYAAIAAATAVDASALLRMREIDAVVLAAGEGDINPALRTLRGANEQVPVILVLDHQNVGPNGIPRLAGYVMRGDRPEKLRRALDRAINGVGRNVAMASAFAAGYLFGAVTTKVGALWYRSARTEDRELGRRPPQRVTLTLVAG